MLVRMKDCKISSYGFGRNAQMYCTMNEQQNTACCIC